MSESNEEWELSKENIQPIQQGRKHKILKSALALHPEDLILQERQAFEHKLRTYSGDDPLSVWCNYIKWVEQNFPKGGREGHIKQIIEQCLSILGNDKKYYDDDRFIDILLKFANINAKPLEVYTHMYAHNIGCKSSKFFISWSWELEQLGNLKKADQVLTEGIQRQAMPFEKIQSYLSEFETRLASKIKEECETKNSEANFGRSAFTMLKPQKKNLAPISRIGEAVVDRRNPFILPRRDPQPQCSKISAPSKVPFKIYNSENVATPLPVQSWSVAPAILHSEDYKENEQKPSKWNKIKVKPRVHSLRAYDETNPSFKFHCDDENEQQNTCTPRSVPKTSNILSVRCRTPSPVMALFEPPDPFKKPMYPKDKVYGGAEEYSLEEIRAAQWFERKKKRNQEIILEEQEKRIEEQAKKEEELKKKIEHLTKQVQLLQTSSVNSASKPVSFPSVPEVNCSNETPGNLRSMGLNNTITNSENSYVSSVRQVPSNLLNSTNNKSKDTSKSIISLHKSSYSLADNFENLYTDSTSCLNDQNKRQTTNSEIFKNSSIRQFASNQTYASNDSNDTSRKMISLQNLHKSNYSLTDSSEIKCTDSTSYCEAAKMVQELYNRTLSYPGDETECKTTSGFNFGLDKKCATKTPSNVCLSDIKEANHREEHKSDMLKELQKDLPFELFHDPTEVVPYSNDLFSNDIGKENLQTHFDLALKRPIIENEDSFDEDGENIPPKEYVQEKSKRELAGILEPSKNILFISLEEQELQDDSDSDDDDDLVCQPRLSHADETLVPPSNTEQFSTAMFLASTPCASRNKDNKFDSADLKDKIPSLGTSNVSQKISLDNKNNQNSAPKESASLLHNVTKPEEKLPKVLSVIMETTENSSKSSSSSSSSVNLTKSGHLDPYSSNFTSVRKPYLKHETFDRYSLSSVSEVPDSTSHVNSCKTNEISQTNQLQHVENAQKFNLYIVDFDPFDIKLTLKLLKSVAFSKYKKLSEVFRSLKSVKVGESIKVGHTNYRIERLIAEGAYAKVLEAVAVQLYVYESDLKKIPLSQRIALKVCRNGNEWEFYVCCEIQNRLIEMNCLSDIKDSVMNISSAIKYTDGIVLANEYSSMGTLLDLVNFYKINKPNGFVNEYIIMYLTLEILHIVSTLHKLNIIHGDIKPDNFLIKNNAFQCNEIYDSMKKGKLTFQFMKPVLNCQSESAFECMSKTTSCLRLIDFGRAIDLNLYDKGICFTKTFSTSNFKCIEMKENKPWVFQLDWYGVLSCIHTMLFSQYMVVKKKNDKWEIEKKFKRYWCHEKLWEPLFSELLNIPACYQEPDLKLYINIIETELQQNSGKFIAELKMLNENYTK